MLKDVLKRLREEAGMTQNQIASLLSISRSTYTYYEIGKTKPSLECIRHMARIYNVSTDYLLEAGTVNAYGKPVGVSQGNRGYRVVGNEAFNLSELDSNEQRIVLSYRMLPDEERKSLLEEIDKKREDYLSQNG